MSNSRERFGGRGHPRVINLALAANSEYIFEKDDFPEVVAGKIPLVANTNYFIQDNINIDTTPFLIPDDSTSNINFVGSAFNSVTITYEGSSVMFAEAGDIGFFSTFDLIYANTGSGTLMNPTASPNPLSQVAILNTLVTGFASLGTWTIRPVILESAFVNNTAGIIINDVMDFRLESGIMLNTSDLGTTFITIGGTSVTTGLITDVTITTQASEKAMDIKSTIAATSLIRIIGNSFRLSVGGFGAMLFSTSIDETDVRVFANDNDGLATSRFIGSFVSQGNVIETVISTIGEGESNYVDFNLGEASGSITVFATNGTGGTTVTSATHLQPNEKLVNIAGTTSYNGKHEIFNITANTFDISTAFIANDATGTWAAGAFPDDDIERWELIDNTTGELKYIGQQPFAGEFIATITAKTASASAKRYKFRLLKNGVDGFAIPNEIKNTVTETTLRKGITAVTNDVFKLQVANFDNTANIIIDTVSAGVG